MEVWKAIRWAETPVLLHTITLKDFESLLEIISNAFIATAR